MKEFTKNALESLGFSKELNNIEKDLCPLCGSDKLDRKDFRDNLSWKEFGLSHMCQECQDSIFN